uniref:Uncharacterized protein n=1 Tax=Arundo donax TaxID=35708 RepID=A0A0A9ECH5_ARUDO
MERKKYLEF